MRIVVDINHPADVHFFKNFISMMEKKGHDLMVTASNKEVSYALLDRFGIKYTKIGSYGNSLLSKMVNVPLLDYQMYRSVKQFNPDLFIGFASVRNAHVSRLLGKFSLAFDDTEHVKYGQALYVPFTDMIMTPACFYKDLGKKQVKFNAYKEIAYLHPGYFSPNEKTLEEIGLAKGDPYFILRFVSWNANHDVGQSGLSYAYKKKLIEELEKHGRVLITSETALPKEFADYRITVSPDKLHDLLSYATFYIGEGATTASECAFLGTHAIYVNTLKLENISQGTTKHGLIHCFSDRENMESEAYRCALDLLQNKDLKADGMQKREQLLGDSIDLTAYMVWFVENYPESVNIVKTDPGFQDNFKQGSDPGVKS